jgi:hypothetical protein
MPEKDVKHKDQIEERISEIQNGFMNWSINQIILFGQG